MYAHICAKRFHFLCLIEHFSNVCLKACNKELSISTTLVSGAKFKT